MTDHDELAGHVEQLGGELRAFVELTASDEALEVERKRITVVEELLELYGARLRALEKLAGDQFG